MKISGFSFVLLAGFITLNTFGCGSTPKSKTATVELPTPLEQCIGRGDDHFDLIKRCDLRTWAEIPVMLEHDKRLAIEIGLGSIHVLPCNPNSSWIGTLEGGLVAKCNKGRVRLYWKNFLAQKTVEKSVDSELPVSSWDFEPAYLRDVSFHVLATVYFGEQVREFAISGTDFFPARFGPRPDGLQADDRVDKVLKEIE